MQYNERCSVHRVDVMSTLGRYHDKCGGRSLGKQLNSYGNPSVLNIPRCTHDPLLYSWYPPTVLNTPRCTSTHDIPQCTEHPQCTEYPPVYCTLPVCTAQTLCRVYIASDRGDQISRQVISATQPSYQSNHLLLIERHLLFFNCAK